MYMIGVLRMSSVNRIRGDGGVIIDSDKYLQLPVAPTKVTIDPKRVGMIRYNLGTQSYEGVLGFTDGSVAYRRFANLDDNGQLLTSQLPDSVTSGLRYGGVYNPLTDDQNPHVAGVQHLPAPTADNSGEYYVISGLYDLASQHYNTNSPSTSPVTFTPVNPSGEGNWLEIKYYFQSTDTGVNITHVFGRLIAAQIPSANAGLTSLATDPELGTFSTTNVPMNETALTDSDWVISSTNTWHRLRQSRVSITAGAVSYDRSAISKAGRLESSISAGVVQEAIDNLFVSSLRRTGDAMFNNGDANNSGGALALVYGTAAKPSLAFNNNPYHPTNNPGTDPSKWTNSGKDGVYFDGTTLGISFNGTGNHEFNKYGQIIVPQGDYNTNGTSLAFDKVANRTGIDGRNQTLSFIAGNIKVPRMTIDGDSVDIDTSVTLNAAGNVVLGTNCANTLTVNSASTFKCDVTLGTNCSNTVTINSVADFKCNVIVGTDNTNTMTVNSVGVFKDDIRMDVSKKIHWSGFTDYASVSFESTADTGGDSRMVFNVGDNADEYFQWTATSGTTPTQVMKLTREGLLIPISNGKPSDSVGEDGMLVYNSVDKVIMAKTDGKWQEIGNSNAYEVKFAVSDWVLDGQYYKYTLTLNNVSSCLVYEQIATDIYQDVYVDHMEISPTGVTVFVTSNNDYRFDGKLVIQFIKK